MLSIFHKLLLSDNSKVYSYNDKDYNFCCSGCVDLFTKQPEKYLAEISKLVVCPICLGEKPIESTIKSMFAGKEFHFCRCPHCIEEFNKNPECFIKHLEGD